MAGYLKVNSWMVRLLLLVRYAKRKEWKVIEEFFGMSMGGGIAFLGSVLTVCLSIFGVLKIYSSNGKNGNGKNGSNGNGSGYIKEMSEMRIECGTKMNQQELKIQKHDSEIVHIGENIIEINSKMTDVFSLINGLNQNVIDVLKMNGLKHE
jgi:hypothetical protein